MREYRSLWRFNQNGMEIFERALIEDETGNELEENLSQFAEPVESTVSFRVRDFTTSKEMAATVLGAFGSANPIRYLADKELWCWVTFVLREQLFKRNSEGIRMLRERHRWFPSNPNDWRKAQRHLVRMPVLLLYRFETDADHLLCSKPSELPDIREQLTSQQDMFNRTFQKVARALYFDDSKKELKPGAGLKDEGTPRRLAKVRQQFDVTWELEDLEWEEILAMLPKEFDRFRPSL